MHRTFKKTDISYDKSIIKNELLKEYGISKFSAASYELTGYVTDLTQEYSQVLLEYGATGKVTNVYSYAEGRVSAIIDGRSYSYLNDGRGSVSELTMTSGSTAVSYRYDIYGKTLASNKCINNPYQYNAEYTDSTTGLQYLRARYYNSDTHRFQTKDTYQGNVAQPITRNNYAYANNNPVNFVDPSGHVAWAIPTAFGSKGLGVLKFVVETYSKVSLGKALLNSVTYGFNRVKEYVSQSREITAQINDIERNDTRTGISTNIPILRNFIRSWNVNCRNEFEDQAKYDQYVDKCEELEQAKKDTVVDIISNDDLKDAITEIFSNIANPGNYPAAYISAQDGDYLDALASLASGVFGDEKNIDFMVDAVDGAFDIIAEIAD